MSQKLCFNNAAGEALQTSATASPAQQVTTSNPPTPPGAGTVEREKVTIYAIRKGKGLTNGIFLRLDDCTHFIEEDSVFATFDNMAAAIQYLTDTTNCSTQQGYKNASTSNLAHGHSYPHVQTFDNEECQQAISKTTFKKSRNRVKAENNPNRRPTKAWEKMYDTFRQYKEEKGSVEVNSTDNHALYKWIKQQELEYKNYQNGKGSSMFPVKIDKLLELGFTFNYVPIQERYEMLFKFKAENSAFPSSSHPILGKWIERQRAVAKKFAKGDDQTYFVSRQTEFDALGLDFGSAYAIPCTEEEKKAFDFESKWNACFDNLIAFKLVHGHLDVKKGNDTALQEWVQMQHQEYLNIQDGKLSNLDVKRVQRLTDAGFEFQRGRNKSTKWEDRIKQLARYKEKHGNLRVPKSHPELGVFVNRQRYEYTKMEAGKASSLNEERIKELESIDFIFKAGKKPKHQEKKTWEDRFKELQDYQDKNGHCLVPQNKTGLGEWVHSQRRHYKHLMEGKTNSLTPPRLLMLANLGFVFDASRKRGHASTNSNSLPQTLNRHNELVHQPPAAMVPTDNRGLADQVNAAFQTTQNVFNSQEPSLAVPNHGFNVTNVYTQPAENPGEIQL